MEKLLERRRRGQAIVIMALAMVGIVRHAGARGRRRPPLFSAAP